MRPPLPTVVAGAAWTLLGLLFITVWFGVQPALPGGEPSVDTITDALGDDAVARSSNGSDSVMLLVLGAAVVFCAACLLLGRRWGHWLSLGMGLVGIVAVASTGRWSALGIAMLLLLVAAVSGNTSGAKRYSSP